MKIDTLLQFTNIRKALLDEKADLTARLIAIDTALGIAPETSPVVATAPAADIRKPKRKVSKATRAKMAASQQARRARAKAPPQPVEQPKKKKFTMGAEAKAAISKAAKARWAKKRAAQKP